MAAADELTPIPAAGALGGSALKDAVLAEARASEKMLYNTVLAQAQRIEVLGDRLVITFAAGFKFGPTFNTYRTKMETMATRLAGRRIIVEADGSGSPVVEEQQAAQPAKPAVDQEKQAALKEQAMADTAVQALLEVFPAEIRDVEEM